MDYKKLYTPSEAAALYNVAKIKYDPTSYALKGNLITNCDHDDLHKEHIDFYTYDTEETLVELIEDEEPTRPTSSFHTDLSGVTTSKYKPWNLASTALIQQDNLFVCLPYLERFFKLEFIKGSKLMQTIVTMCIALNSNKSCAKDMLWLSLYKTNTQPYAELHTFSQLKKELANGDSIMILDSRSGIDFTYAPTIPVIAGVKVEAYTNDTQSDYEALYINVVNSFEVLWAWNTLPNELKECFAYACNQAQTLGVADYALFSYFFQVSSKGITVTSPLKEAIEISNPEERYKAYQDILASVDLRHICANYYEHELKRGHVLNPIIAMYTMFVTQLSVSNIRINTVRMLYEYCQTHGYLKKLEEDTLDTSAMSFMTKSLGLSLSPGSKSEERSLMDLHDKPSGKGEPLDDSDEEGCHDSDPLFEALDKVKASFKSGKYRFDVQDVIDTSPEHKSKYDAVAKKVEMVNKLLTRRIRDIKTYNVGGKNPGASTGRLDRKAMYRYKYDPNIFYNNTYKTLESDLAFGIVLDESGSMHGSGIENGRITMIVLHETLKALGINHSIVGHTSDGRYHSEITRYQAFREDKTYTTCKNYAIVAAKAKCGNCDSGALYYMEKALERVRNKDKICLIFSDGAPTECTGTDLKNQVAHMEKQGIKVIGIGINFESISKYYKDYANGRNLSDMLNIISKILEEYVLKKKG